jgi:transcriptional regulator with XRE-family HTH domain
MKPLPPTYQVDGDALREARMRKGLLPKEVAEASGLSRSYIQRLETGSASGRMRPGNYVALRTAVTATDDELLTPTEDPPEER